MRSNALARILPLDVETSIAGLPLDIDSLRTSLFKRPELVPEFVRYSREASFFHNLLQTQLKQIPPGSRIIEIGSGVGLLSMMLSADGFWIEGFEPFSHGYEKAQLVHDALVKSWTGPPVAFHDFEFQKAATNEAAPTFFLAINVMEHVMNPKSLLQTVRDEMAPADSFRLIFPNYTIPYEPHFNIPVAFTKGLTYRLMGPVIRHLRPTDYLAFWGDLSFPKHQPFVRLCHELGFIVQSSNAASLKYVERLKDTNFTSRKGWGFRALAISHPLLTRAFRALPHRWLPVADLTITI